jgi:hypothetical protein
MVIGEWWICKVEWLRPSTAGQIDKERKQQQQQRGLMVTGEWWKGGWGSICPLLSTCYYGRSGGAFQSSLRRVSNIGPESPLAQAAEALCLQVETFLALELNANDEILVRRLTAFSTFPSDAWQHGRWTTSPSSGGQSITRDRAQSRPS